MPCPLQHRSHKGTGRDTEVALCSAHPVPPNYLLGLPAAKVIELGSAASGGSHCWFPPPTCRYSGSALHELAVLCVKYHFLDLSLYMITSSQESYK